jgi:hypothetical protein
MAGGLTLAALLHWVRLCSVSAVEFDAKGNIRRVCFTGERAQPQVDVGAPPVRAVHLGPASVGGESRRRMPVGTSPCRRRGQSSGNDRPSPAPDLAARLAARLSFCPLRCCGQSLVWFVPIPVVFADSVSASSRRYVARARRLRGFVWLARQCLARRRLALVARGFLNRGRARARLCAVAVLRRFALARGALATRHLPVSAELVDSLSAMSLTFVSGPAPAVDDRVSTQASRCYSARVGAAEERRRAARAAEVDVRRAANNVSAPSASKGLKRPASSSTSLHSHRRRPNLLAPTHPPLDTSTSLPQLETATALLPTSHSTYPQRSLSLASHKSNLTNPHGDAPTSPPFDTSTSLPPLENAAAFLSTPDSTFPQRSLSLVSDLQQPDA